MQEQGKRILLAVVISIGIFVAWNAAFPPKKDKPKPNAGSGSGSGALVAPKPTGPAPLIAEAPRGPETLLEFDFPTFRAKFTSWGGALKSWQLKDKRYERDASRGELVPQFAEAAILQTNFVESTAVLPINSDWQGEKVNDTTIRYTLAANGLVVTKTFTIYPEAYLLRTKVDVASAAGEVKQRLVLSVFGFQDPKAKVGGGQSVKGREWQSATQADGHSATSFAKVKESPRTHGNVEWTGFEHPYLFQLTAPRHAETESIEKFTYAASQDGLMRTDIWFPAASITPAAPVSREAVTYIGPNYYDRLKSADETAGFDTGFHHIVDLGWFKFIGRPLLWLLKAIHGVVGNWGLAIIVLTFLVKLATLYWTTKSTRSMKAMGALAPRMKELQERYKGDRQRLQQEQMALYKTHGVNPLAGCLPMLLQMPIWIALYRMLSSAGELYLQPFIPGWIDDLTNSDPYYILPIAVMVSQFVQMKLTPTTMDSTQQKIMVYAMPLLFGIMGLVFPAGLSLYMFTNSVLSGAHSIYLNKYDRKTKEAVEKIKQAMEPKVVEKKVEKKAADDAGEPPLKNGASTKPASAANKNKKKSNKRR